MDKPFVIPTINGKARRVSEWGCYPLFYYCADGGALCPACVDENRDEIDAAAEYADKQWLVVGVEANYENTELFCDHCNERIESAYADDDEEE